MVTHQFIQQSNVLRYLRAIKSLKKCVNSNLTWTGVYSTHCGKMYECQKNDFEYTSWANAHYSSDENKKFNI